MNYLNVNINITNKIQTSHKIYDNLKYLNSISTQPKSVKDALIENIGKGISMLSSDHDIKHVTYYN